jgi:hypothetical protein
MIGVSVSYLHHLMYPDTLSENDLARGQIRRVELRLETKRMGNTALNPLDQPVDELALMYRRRATPRRMWKP